MTPNFIQAAFCPKNLYKRLKFRMQPVIVVNYKDHEEILRSEVIDLLENIGKYHFFHSNSISIK